jgi:hypothetical protein
MSRGCVQFHPPTKTQNFVSLTLAFRRHRSHDQLVLCMTSHNKANSPTTTTMSNNNRTRTKNGRPISKKNGRPMSAAAAADLAQQRADQKMESKRRKEQFLVFIKALMRDLAQMDPKMHAKAKAIIQDCTDKKKRRVPGFDFETTMRKQLLVLVGESNWRRVERDLHRRTLARSEEKQHRRQCSTDISVSSHSSTASLSLTSDEPEPESRQEPAEGGAVTLAMNDLSLNDGSVEVTEKELVETMQSRPQSAVVMPDEPRFIYI